MGEDWDFYLALIDGEPASIYLDLGLAPQAPLEHQPFVAFVRLNMRSPLPDGLSSPEEFDDLVRVEDVLVAFVTGGEGATYVGRNTSGGNRDFFFYLSEPEGFPERVKEAMQGHPLYRFEIGIRSDPDWETYSGFLYPSQDDLQRILNRRVTDALAARGDDLSKPRTIDHLAYLPDAKTAERARDHVVELDFRAQTPRQEGASFALGFSRTDRPENIDEVVLPVARLIRELGGEYDGWGCEVVN